MTWRRAPRRARERRTAQPRSIAALPAQPGAAARPVVGHRRHRDGHRDRPRSVATVTLSPSAATASAAVAGGHPGHGGAGRARARVGSPSCIRPLSRQLVPGGQFTPSTPDPCAWRSGARPGQRRAPLIPAGRGRCRARCRARPARRGRRPRRAGRGGRPSASAIAPSTYRSAHLAGSRSAALERAAAGPPSSRTCRPSRPRRATGSTTSARSVTALARSSRLTTNRRRSRARPARRPGPAGRRVDARRPPGRRCSPCRGRGQDRRGVAARACRAAMAHAPGPGHLDAAPPGRRSTGRRAAARAARPTSIAPRSPARRGTQASRAPVAASQRGAAAVSAPGDLGQPLADQDHRRPAPAPGGAITASEARARPRPPQRGLASSPGTRLEQRAGQPGEAVAGQRGEREHAQAVLADRLAQPQEDDRATRPPARNRPAARPGPLPGRRSRRRCRARPRGGQELRLLGGVRPGPEVDVVGVRAPPGRTWRRRRRPRR